MTWLTVPTGLILAAAVIPPLVLLYFLKLRRREHPIASTLLWMHAVEDLRANAPFQRLRFSILLLLQLIILAMLILSVMQPQIQAGDVRGGKTVILVDNSGSMRSTDGADGATRLEEVKERLVDMIEARYAGGLFSDSPGETMIVAFNNGAEIMARFTTSKSQLLDAVRAIRPTDGETNLEEALKLARAYTTNVNPDNDRPIAEAATLELFSDGRIIDLPEQVLRMEQMLYHPIGDPDADNVALTSIAVDRPYDRPTDVQVFAALANFGPTPASCDVELSVDGTVRAITPEPIEVPPAEVDPESGNILPGRNNVVFTPFRQPEGAIIQVRNLRTDVLPTDNTARVVVPPPKQLRVALVSASRNVLFRLALEGQTLERIEILSPTQFTDMITAGQTDQYDVVVLDNLELDFLPAGRYLSFGKTPPMDGLNEYGEGKEQLIVSSNKDHAALRYVNLDDVYIQKFHLLQPADDVTIIAEINNDGVMVPAMLEVSRGGAQVVHLPFDITDSTLYRERAFPNFLVNVIEYLGYSRQSLSLKGYRPGDAITARLPRDATDITMELPDGRTESLRPLDPSLLSWGPTRVAGLHTLSWTAPSAGPDRQTRIFAVNLLSETEGQVRPRDTITLSEERIEGLTAAASAYTPLWPWAAGLGLALLMFEWWFYHRKAV